MFSNCSFLLLPLFFQFTQSTDGEAFVFYMDGPTINTKLLNIFINVTTSERTCMKLKIHATQMSGNSAIPQYLFIQ